MEVQLRNSIFPDYVYGALILGLLLMIILKFSSQFSVFSAIKNFIIPSAEDSKENKIIFILTGLVFFASSVTLAIQLFTSSYEYQEFLYLSGAVLSYFLIRYLVLGVVTFVSENLILFQLQRRLSYDFLFVTAMFLYAINVYNIFSSIKFEYQYLLPIVLIALSYLVWLIQISIQIIRHHVNTLYLILYLCAFEILPLVLLFKVFIGKI